jgi:hypothetical protein
MLQVFDRNGDGNFDHMDVVETLMDLGAGVKRGYDTFQGLRPTLEQLGNGAKKLFKRRGSAVRNNSGGGAEPPTNKSDMEALLAALKPKRTNRAKKLSSFAKRIAQKQQYDYNTSKRKKAYEDYKAVASMVPAYEDIYGSGAYKRRARRRRPVSRSRAKGRRVRGRGAYSIGGAAPGINSYSNSLFQVGSSANIPRFSTVSDELGGIVITRKEYVMDIKGSADFDVQTFFINPGNPYLWSWLSQLAPNFEEYEFLGIVFTYNTVTALLSTTSSQVGTVIMACDYNACNEDFTSKQEMLQYAGAASIQINNNLEFGIECDPSKNASVAGSQFITSAINPDNLKSSNANVNDPKTYFLGQFSIATCNVPSNAQIGELWVSYSVRLKKPKLYDALGKGNDQFIMNSESGPYFSSDSNGNIRWGYYGDPALSNFTQLPLSPYSEGAVASALIPVANNANPPTQFPDNIAQSLYNSGAGGFSIYYNTYNYGGGSGALSYAYRFDDNATGSYFVCWSIVLISTDGDSQVPLKCTPYNYLMGNPNMIFYRGSQGIVNESDSNSITGSFTVTINQTAIESGYYNANGNSFVITAQDLKTFNASIFGMKCKTVFSVTKIDPTIGAVPGFGTPSLQLQ